MVGKLGLPIQPETVYCEEELRTGAVGTIAATSGVNWTASTAFGSICARRRR